MNECADRGELALARLIGQSPSIRQALHRIRRIAATVATVLIEGETGTGKELAARAIHYLGARRDFPFVPVNCGALPDNLIENELFGHERGAFTGAVGEYPGVLRFAQRGTLFLDEVDSLSERAQVVLLRFLEDQTFRPLGGSSEARADVRIIAASNASLEGLVRAGRFRTDLYYRLRAMFVCLPPLREREGDVEVLARHFIRECAREHRMQEKPLHPETLRWMRFYSWPGNVRELENVIQCEFLLSDDPCVVARPPDSRTQFASGEAPPERKEDTHVSYTCARLRVLEDFDRTYLASLLSRTRGNVTQAAKLAGKERRALGKLIKRYAIQPDRFRT
jgi:transcriptional regulator with PAS, ATPase and Fis domain